jgi:opacity protein-like surface antigen
MGQEYGYGSSAGGGGKSGFYLAPRFMDSLANTGNVGGSGGRASKTYNTFGGALAAGFYLSSLDSGLPLRMEIEYAMRSDIRASWDSNSGIGIGKFDAVFNVQTLLGNLYWDIETGSPFRPFVGGGLGASFIYAEYKPADSPSYSSKSTSLAWNVGAGIGYDLNESATLELAYRFVGFGNAQASRSGGGTTKNYMTANEFIVGLRLNF